MKLRGFIIISLICLCSIQGSAAQDPGVKKLVESNDLFAFDFYNQVKTNKGNIVFSPFSISLVASMAYSGAEGETEAQIKRLLHVNLPEEKHHTAYSKLLPLINNTFRQSKNELYIGNSLWVQKDKEFKQRFTKILRTKYGTPLNETDFFNNPQLSSIAINRWIKKKTNNKVPALLPAGVINEDTRLVLVNAIYLNSSWNSKFKKKHTYTKPFKIKPDATVKTRMMHQQNTFRYMSNNLVQVIVLPYVGKRLAMGVILPKEDVSISDVEDQLSPEKINSWFSKLSMTDVQVSLPKFKMKTSISLNKTLSEMGMKDAFIPKTANFQGMDGAESIMYINTAMHEAGIDVHEQGTTAYATTLSSNADFGDEVRSVRFNANRPFIFMIVDQGSGSILFFGRMSNPAL